MAGVADRAFRRLCVVTARVRGFGDGQLQGAVFWGSQKRGTLMLDEDEHPAAVQLFGDDPDIMAAGGGKGDGRRTRRSSTSIWAARLPKMPATTAGAR